MTEYAVFNDEGCVASGFWTLAAAELEAAMQRLEGDEGAHAEEMCDEPDHDEQPKFGCEACATDGTEDDTDEDEENE